MGGGKVAEQVVVTVSGSVSPCLLDTHLAFITAPIVRHGRRQRLSRLLDLHLVIGNNTHTANERRTRMLVANRLHTPVQVDLAYAGCSGAPHRAHGERRCDQRNVFVETSAG